MGSISGDDDDETQPYDSQPSPLPGDDINEKDLNHLLQYTWPTGETVPAEDGLDTQVMNFEGETQFLCDEGFETQVLFDEGLETQVMNFEGETQVLFENVLETQVMNFAGDTQVLEDFVGFDNIDTQLLGECNSEERVKTDGEESDKTDVLCDTTALSDNDSLKIVDHSSADCKNANISEQDDKANTAVSDASFFEQTSAGVKMNFTSVRAAALRASGLAARSKNAIGSNSKLRSSKTENTSLKEDHACDYSNVTSIQGSQVREMEIDGVVGDGETDGIKDKSKGRSGTSAARRLFMDDDKLDENEGLEDTKLSDTDEVDFLQCNAIAGLSYVDSQEPGDLSQANALDVVDKFLKSNDIDFDKGVGVVRSTAKKSKPDSSIKGTNSLAKKSRLKRLSGETEIFSWDDDREDEGGGEFFSRNKKVFFDDDKKDSSRSLSTKKGASKRTAKKPKVADLIKNLTKDFDEQVNVDILDEKKAICSGKESNVADVTKNLTKELDEQVNVDTLDGKEANCSVKDLPDMSKKVRASKRTAKKRKVGDIIKNLTKELDEQANADTLDGKEAKCSGKGLQVESKRVRASKRTAKKPKVGDIKKNLTKELDEQANADTLDGKEANCSGKGLQVESKRVRASKRTAKKPKVGDIKKNLTKELDEQVNVDTLDGKEANCSGKELQVMSKSVRTSKRTAKKPKVGDIKKNLTKELDEQVNGDTLDGKKANCSGEELQDLFNVGPDTQMAAEAMEELCLGLEVTGKDTEKFTETTSKSSFIVEKEDKFLHKKYPLRKRSSPSSCEDIDKKSKQRKKSGTSLSRELSVSPTKQTKNAKEQHKDLYKSLISPSSEPEKIPTCAPVASRTKRHCVTRQWIAGNLKCDSSTGTLSYKKGRRSNRELSENEYRPMNQLSSSETKEKPHKVSNGPKTNPQIVSADTVIQRKTRSSLRAGTALPSSNGELKRSLCNNNGVKEKLEEGILKGKLRDGIKAHSYFSGGNLNLDVSPGERSKLSVLTSTTPTSCTSSAAAVSPICMGDEYLKQSCRKNLSASLVKEIGSLVSNGPKPSSIMKESRKRRDMANVQVLFSHHLDDDIIKHQEKILAKLGASVASSIREATHFVTDKFVRTRNMLEAIASGKPVVTHLWLESCGEASCCIDERNYILRDAKKEKEFGFSLPASLAHACQQPLLQGFRVWITPNTKPGLEILSSLVKAVHGLPVERIGRSVLTDEKVPDDLLALSCEEDYGLCVPFLEKGGAVFSSELLLNGIVTQRLEYERHRLFDDRVKKTRSTRWMKRDNNQYLPVAKCK